MNELGKPAITPQDINHLEALTEGSSNNRANAQSLMTLVTSKLYDPILPKEMDTDLQQVTEEVQSIELTANQLAIYPNPFIGQTTIVYQVEQQQTKVDITIVDVTGKVVAAPVQNLSRDAGQHSITVTDEMLSGAGVYFVLVHYNNELMDQAKLILF